MITLNTQITAQKVFSLAILTLLLTAFFSAPAYSLSSFDKKAVEKEKDQLVVLWTTADREVAMNMLMMYTYNAKKNNWWKDIVVIVWGPSTKLLSEDAELQTKVKEMIKVGVTVKACKGCADQYEGSAQILEDLGIEVLYVGKEFTDYLKSESTLLTL